MTYIYVRSVQLPQAAAHRALGIAWRCGCCGWGAGRLPRRCVSSPTAHRTFESCRSFAGGCTVHQSALSVNVRCVLCAVWANRLLQAASVFDVQLRPTSQAAAGEGARVVAAEEEEGEEEAEIFVFTVPRAPPTAPANGQVRACVPGAADGPTFVIVRMVRCFFVTHHNIGESVQECEDGNRVQIHLVMQALDRKYG